MARAPRIEVPGALYHVIARGNQRRTVFRDTVDYRCYLDLLVRYQHRHGLTLYAYALMPNHLHLLISPNRAPLSKIMQGLQQTYTRHFNRRHRLVGHCFQGRYKAILCQSDAYLLELVRYLHSNPVRAGLASTPEEYEWTSHRLYLAGRDAGGVAVEAVLGQFSANRTRAVTAFRSFVEAGLPAGHREDFYAVSGQRLLGTSDSWKKWSAQPVGKNECLLWRFQSKPSQSALQSSSACLKHGCADGGNPGKQPGSGR